MTAYLLLFLLVLGINMMPAFGPPTWTVIVLYGLNTGKPVYNFRSEGREFGNSESGGRCLIIADGFYEFTTSATEPGTPKPKRKDKWLFTKKDEPFFCIAGIWRTSAVGEAFTMLTTEPGPDVAPYHDRQVVVLGPADWARWLDPGVPARDVLKPLPAGTLDVEKVG